MLEWIRFGLVAFFFAAGLISLFISISGVFRLKYAIDKLHSSAITDTLVLMCFLSGCIIASGISITSLKLIIVLIIQWCTSPLVAHIFVKAKVRTDEKLPLYCELPEDAADESVKNDEEEQHD